MWYGGHVSFCSETSFHVWLVALSVIDLLIGLLHSTLTAKGLQLARRGRHERIHSDMIDSLDAYIVYHKKIRLICRDAGRAAAQLVTCHGA